MTKEEKDLLLTDLCSRLPYGVIAFYEGCDFAPTQIDITDDEPRVYFQPSCEYVNLYEVTQYLRPISSMTEEELKEYILITETVIGVGKKDTSIILNLDATDWLNAHHFDYRGLIEHGLAIEAPEEMYKR